MAIEEVKIPQERVAVLVGTKGSMRRKIEKISSTKLIVDSANGDVKIEGEDSLKVFTTRDVVKAIGMFTGTVERRSDAARMESMKQLAAAA